MSKVVPFDWHRGLIVDISDRDHWRILTSRNWIDCECRDVREWPNWWLTPLPITMPISLLTFFSEGNFQSHSNMADCIDTPSYWMVLRLHRLQLLNWLSTSMPSELSMPTTFNAVSSRCGEDITISSITRITLSLSDHTNTSPPDISGIISTHNESKVPCLRSPANN